MAGTALLITARNEISSEIAGLTVEDGYNFCWGSVNQIDRVAGDVWPRAIVRIDSVLNLDNQEDQSHSQAYQQQATFVIEVECKNQEVEDSPWYEIEERYLKALDDLLEKFEGQYDWGNIYFVDMIWEEERNADIFTPKKMITTWQMLYTQDRQAPATSADV